MKSRPRMTAVWHFIYPGARREAPGKRKLTYYLIDSNIWKIILIGD